MTASSRRSSTRGRTASGGSRLRGGWLRPWRMLLILSVLALVLVLERAPVAAISPPPGSEDVRGARSVYERVRMAQDLPGQQVISATWEELAAVAMLGGRAAGFQRVSVTPDPTRIHVAASVDLPLGFWLNGHGYVVRGKDGRARISARVGDLPVPAFVVHPLIGAGRLALRMRGARIAPLDEMLLEVRIGSAGVAARVDLSGDTGVMHSLSGLVSQPVEPARVERHYCQLVQAQRQRPRDALVDHVHRAFGRADGTAADNRAAFVALSMLVARMDGNAVGAAREAIFRQCGMVEDQILLQGRGDLAMHWAVSAALASAFGSDVSLSMGLWKEISDSGDGGSGFSLVDLAADRSGVFCAQRGADTSQAAATRDWLASVSEAELLPVSALAFAEGMTEQEFRERFADTDSEQFAAVVQRIDSQLAILLR